MTFRPVTSSDPRKPRIVAALKTASGARAVTQVAEVRGIGDRVECYVGHCLTKGRAGRGFGHWLVDFSESSEGRCEGPYKNRESAAAGEGAYESIAAFHAEVDARREVLP